MLNVSMILLLEKKYTDKHHEHCQYEAFSVLMQQWAVTGFLEYHYLAFLCYKMEYESSEKHRVYYDG